MTRRQRAEEVAKQLYRDAWEYLSPLDPKESPIEDSFITARRAQLIVKMRAALLAFSDEENKACEVIASTEAERGHRGDGSEDTESKVQIFYQGIMRGAINIRSTIAARREEKSS